jgi:DNA phosphorothioation-associated putative methyltransferase
MLNYHKYIERILSLPYGKKVKDSIYVHLDFLATYDQMLDSFVRNIAQKAKINNNYNVIKFIKSEFRISFLNYPNFFKIPHPELKASVAVNLATGKIKSHDYSISENPPILHRKEALLKPNHRLIQKFKTLTETEEKEGLYANTKIIGFKKNWEQLLKRKGLSYDGHKLIKIKPITIDRPDLFPKVERHKTAISRYNFSRPIQTLHEYNLINEEATFFDYGCGQGDDVKGLKKMGIGAFGWDPIHKPNYPKKEVDIVNLGFVLNVIEDPIERIETLVEAFSFAKKLLVVSCQVATSNTQNFGRPYKDGILTSKNTFQKYFHQNELRQYIEDGLETSAIAVGPGIFYVFRSPIDMQEFISNRSKRPINWEQISHRLYPDRTQRRKLKREAIYEENKELLDSFWSRMLDLGRIPNQGEFDKYIELKKKIGTPNYARKLFVLKFGENTLRETFELRKNDLLVYLALSNFKKRVPLKYLPKSLQTDIKTFLGSYRNAIEVSRSMLFSIGNPLIIEEICAKTNFGFFDHKALYVHRSLINELHPILRIYIGCAGILYGDLKNADIIKIHKKSGKVTLLKYDNFEGKNLPELQERIKVNLRRQRIEFFDHQLGLYQQLLYFKEQYVGKDHPDRPKWERFSKKLRKFGFNNTDPIGLPKQEFYSFIEQNDLTPSLNKRRRIK